MSQTVYVDRKFIKLTSEKKQLIFHTQEGKKSTLPFRLIDRLIIQGHCLIDTYLLSKLSENNITTVLFTNLRAQQMAVIDGLQHNNASIHIKQYRFHQEKALTLDAATRLVKAKLLRQYRLMKRMQTKHPEKRKVFFDATNHLYAQINHVDNSQTTAQLLGVEGYAAKVYFSAYTQLFPKQLNFNSRQRRPPRDPVNAMLSLSYSIFSARCSQALSGVGLDPYIGFYHKISYSRKSLSVDMIEPWRPLIDQFVYELFQNKILDSDLFDYKGAACLLNKEGRSLFYPAFEHAMKTWQKGVNHMARLMVRELEQKIPSIENINENYNLF